MISEREAAVIKLAERWDRLVYKDNPDYRTCAWEYLGIPFLICYHVESGRFHLFIEGRMHRWDVTATSSVECLRMAGRYVSEHRHACDDVW